MPIWEGGRGLPGCLSIGEYPGGDGLILVTAGDLRGSVWCTVSYGIPEIDRSYELRGFLDWFANTLTVLQAGG